MLKVPQKELLYKLEGDIYSVESIWFYHFHNIVVSISLTYNFIIAYDIYIFIMV